MSRMRRVIKIRVGGFQGSAPGLEALSNKPVVTAMVVTTRLPYLLYFFNSLPA
jgi:hypothetical protein